MTGDRLTTPGPDDVRSYLDAVPDERRRADAVAALELIREVTGAEPVMWGRAMIGFGVRPYTTADGKRREWFAVGLSPRKAALTLYGLTDGPHQDLLDRLGPHTTGTGCLYVKRLDDVDRGVLVELVKRSWASSTST